MSISRGLVAINIRFQKDPLSMQSSRHNLAVEIDALHKWYGTFHVLKGIDLSVAHGSRIVICGPSGSGKSTLIRCINGLEAYQQGTIRLDGTRLGEDAGLTALARRQTGMVFQNFNLFPHLNVLSNCTLALRRVAGMARTEAESLAHHYLEKVRIPEQAYKYPAQLSGGQQQRVAIARALCMSPRLMLFDEPTSALDPELVNEVLAVIQGLANDGMTLIIVTHEMRFAREVCNRVVFLDKGAIADAGPPAHIFGATANARTQEFVRNYYG